MFYIDMDALYNYHGVTNCRTNNCDYYYQRKQSRKLTIALSFLTKADKLFYFVVNPYIGQNTTKKNAYYTPSLDWEIL